MNHKTHFKIICTVNHSHTTDCIDRYTKIVENTFKMISCELDNRRCSETEDRDDYYTEDEYDREDREDREYGEDREDREYGEYGEYSDDREDKCPLCPEISGGGLCLDCKMSC